MHVKARRNSRVMTSTIKTTSLPCACNTLRKGSRALSRVYDEALAPSGLRVTQYSLLATLQRRGALPVTQLAEELVLDRTTLSHNLNPLEREGLIAIEPGNDRRTRYARLTPAGEERWINARPLWRAAQERVAAAFGTERLGVLLGEIAAITEAMR